MTIVSIRLCTTRCLRLALGATVAMCAAFSAWSAESPQVAQGRAIYHAKGCYQCHGTVGQGANTTGPAVARTRFPAAAFKAYIRSPMGSMPLYSPTLLPDAEVDALFAFLQSLPPPPSPADIPMLAPYVRAQ